MSEGTLKGLSDTVAGKAKRALREPTGRPDIVLDGERQETLGHKETLEAERQARSETRSEKGERSVAGEVQGSKAQINARTEKE